MKYTLDTIPVWDAYRTGHDCPLCTLQILSEDKTVDSLLSSAYMEPDCRIATNAKGFCRDHVQMLYGRRNRLGLALMMETHIEQLRASLDALSTPPGPKRISFPGKHPGTAAQVQSLISSCYLCEQIQAHLKMYCFTIASLYLDKPEFRTMAGKSHGFCLPHLQLFLQVAEECLPKREADTVSRAFLDITKRDLEQLQAGLNAFSKQFDYRSQGTPAPRDAVERALNKRCSALYGPDAVRPTHND